MPAVSSDLVFAARLLRKSRGFALVATTSLALAIGANTIIFSIAKQLLFERLDVPNAATLRLLAAPDPALSYPVYQQLRAENQVLGDLLAFHTTAVNATAGNHAERVVAHEVSGNYYDVLGIRPQLGRGIRPGDDTAASEVVVVISDGFWEREFARSPAVLGTSIALNDVPATVVGVNPQGFTGAASTLPSQSPDVIVALAKATLVTPASTGQDWLADPAAGAVSVMGRTKPDVNERQAQAALDTQFSGIVRAIVPLHAGAVVPRLTLRDGSRGLFAQQQAFATPITVLMIFLALVLLLACANIATLMLARGARRQGEISLRLALGASRARILRQVLAESLLLAAIGGACGLLIAYLGRDAFSGYSPHFDWAVFGFTASISIATGVLFGFAPALGALHAPIASGIRGRTAGRFVVGFQIALATLLLISAGLFMRSLAGLTAVAPGFRTDHLLLAEIVLPQNRYPAGANVAFHQRLEQAIGEIPGVVAVAGAEAPYLSDERLDTTLLTPGELADPSRDSREPYNAVGVRFFETLGIPIVAGRGFTSGDTAASPKVAVINQRLAATRFPNENPIGKHISLGGVHAGYGDLLTGDQIEIVGIAGNSLYGNLHEAPPPQLFVPYVQQTQVRRLTYQIRTRVEPAAIVESLRRVVHAADPALPLVRVRTQQDQIDADLADERLLVSLSSAFGLLALVLAAVGIYGLLAYSVSQRTREIGVRLAVGAIPRQILAMVLRESLSLSVMAVAAGMLVSVLAARFVRSVLFGVAPSDPAVLWGAGTLLILVVLGASWLPARRAAGVQPMEALRRD